MNRLTVDVIRTAIAHRIPSVRRVSATKEPVVVKTRFVAGVTE